ncbi:phytanoyl-CoA dioxygenase family protein [Ideonella sp. DXS22W]|uniref:Phytanoyl-CoA dioxygenase family protein n=1 Tax=Pseudaquabacterium inlustre TaxID=2984192 RepID=A0ABU9CGZ0_9BURK
MAFEFSDRHIVEYHTQGYVVLRDLLPATLLTDLRRETDRGREIARRLGGGNAQRLQPVQEHLDPRPFAELWGLPALHHALTEILRGIEFSVEGDAVLYEPGESPYCMCWHRDFRDLSPGMDLAAWQASFHDLRLFNQTNVALYDDACLWVVPGSHLRADTPDEIRRFPERPVPAPDFTGLTPEQAEYTARDYAHSMPGAVQAPLNAGDFMVYRNTLWHLGSYVPYIKRATVHGSIVTEAYRQYVLTQWLPYAKGELPRVWHNVNAGTPAYREGLWQRRAGQWAARLRRLAGA